MPVSEPQADSAIKGRILVVDDEERNRRLLRGILLYEKYQVTEAVNGEQALQLVATEAIDAILLDVMMPGIDGFEVCRRLKAEPETAHIPVLLITALTAREDRLKGMEAGADDFISKPVDSGELLLRVRNAVFAKHQFDENLTLRRDLEKKAAKQTVELRRANAKLLLQVKELEGRDRFVRFQMRGASLAESYQEIMQVLVDVLEPARLVIYRPSETLNQLVEVASLTVSETTSGVGKSRSLSSAAVKLVEVAFREKKLQPAPGGEAAVPIMYAEEAAGVIWVAGLPVGEWYEEALDILWRMGLEAALVLRMAQFAEDIGNGRLDLDALLNLTEPHS